MLIRNGCIPLTFLRRPELRLVRDDHAQLSERWSQWPLWQRSAVA